MAHGFIKTRFIRDAQVTAAKLATDAVTAAAIAANTITATEIAANTITAAEIAALTITAAEITANTITAAKLATKAMVLTLTPGAETSDVIDVVIQLEDEDAVAIASAEDLLCQVLDVNAELAAVTAITCAETDVGTEVTATARPAIVITTDANGAATLSVTDVAGASGLTFQVVVTPLDRTGAVVRAAISFD